MLLLNWCCCFACVAAAILLLLYLCCSQTGAAAKLVLLLNWCSCQIGALLLLRTGAASALMLMQWCRCTPFNIQDKQGQAFPVLVLFYTTHTLHIFAIDTNLQYFAFSYILIICSLHLHKFSYDSQIHNVLTCVNTLHFSEWNSFKYFSPFDNLYNSEVGVCDTLCIPPDLESILPEIKLSLFQFCWTLTFSIKHPTQSHFEKNYFCYTFTFLATLVALHFTPVSK